ncbi:MAG: hypothetical protein AAF226_06620, partial [Verrucomicrobiota bacterium]
GSEGRSKTITGPKLMVRTKPEFESKETFISRKMPHFKKRSRVPLLSARSGMREHFRVTRFLGVRRGMREHF